MTFSEARGILRSPQPHHDALLAALVSEHQPEDEQAFRLVQRAQRRAAELIDGWLEFDAKRPERYYPARQSDAPGFARGF